MPPLERALRVMTHLNIGATLATAAWLVWTGTQLVSGDLRPVRTIDPVALRSAALRSVPSEAAALPPCHLIEAAPDDGVPEGATPVDAAAALHAPSHRTALAATPVGLTPAEGAR